MQGKEHEMGKKYFLPNFNARACEYFDKLIKENNIHIQHALNGGEFCVKGLGYFVDGYDADNNVVYEFDEKHHFDVDGNLRESDIKTTKRDRTNIKL